MMHTRQHTTDMSRADAPSWDRVSASGGFVNLCWQPSVPCTIGLSRLDDCLKDLLFSDMPICICLIPRPSPVIALVIPHHRNGLFHKRRPHHGSVKDHVLLSVDGTHKQGLSLLGAVLVHVAADIWFVLERAHLGQLLVDNVHALHGISLHYHGILAHLGKHKADWSWKEKTAKTTPFAINTTRSQVSYHAAQDLSCPSFPMRCKGGCSPTNLCKA